MKQKYYAHNEEQISNQPSLSHTRRLPLNFTPHFSADSLGAKSPFEPLWRIEFPPHIVPASHGKSSQAFVVD